VEKILAIIDGSNFYHRSKCLCPNVHLTNFNYRKLVEQIVGAQNTKHLQKVRILYCVGEIKRESGNEKAEKMYSQQQSLFYNLEQQKIGIYKGFMLKSDGKYHEKGVDVRIAVEIVKGALKNEYNKCFLFSSDTDIIPAILEAKKVKKEIIYVGFENKLSRAMMKNCSRTEVVRMDKFRI